MSPYMYWVVVYIIVIAAILVIVYVNGGDYSTPEEFERKDDPHDPT